jgi:PAP2 superfamily
MSQQTLSSTVGSRRHRALALMAALVTISAFQGCGGGGNTSEITPLQTLLRWNGIATDASGVAHGSGGEQLGPGRSSRAMAITHIAMFETLLAVHGGYQSYVNLAPPAGTVSQSVAIAKAARDTLVILYPSQAQTFDDALDEDLAKVEDGSRKNNGLALGAAAASAIMAMRTGDGSEVPEMLLGPGGYVPGNAPGEWRQDPISQIPVALGASWGACLPFVIASPDQFRCPVPPALTSSEYATAYNEVKDLGGDGVGTSTNRTPDQTVAGIYWAYDGVPNLCAPPRLYNQVANLIAAQQGFGLMEWARMLALLHTSMADAGTASWESKYFYKIWRPVCGIRESDPGTGPSGLGDGNGATLGDVNFSPLGAPASNTTNPNFTPPFPAYPSGHATFGGAIFQILRRMIGTDNVQFTFVSDEFNGVTTDNTGNPRPYLPRTFNNFSQAEEENGQSRIYLGIHWSFDKTAGIAMGNQVGDWVFDHMYQPIP